MIKKILTALGIVLLGLIGSLSASMYYNAPIGTGFGGGGGGDSSINNSPITRISVPMNTASSTVCALPLPTATSSILAFKANFITGTSSQGVLLIGTSTTAFASSTSMVPTRTITANTTPVVSWAPDFNASTSPNLASPNTFIVVNMTNGSAVPYGYTYGGTCDALVL